MMINLNNQWVKYKPEESFINSYFDEFFESENIHISIRNVYNIKF